MARKMRKVGEQGPYGTRGRSHATLHRDMAFRHEDHSKCPAGCRAGCRPHLMIAPADAAAQSVDRGGFGGPRRPATALSFAVALRLLARHILRLHGKAP